MGAEKHLIFTLIAAVFVAYAIKEGMAIKCWVCRSDADNKCADPFDNTSFPITDCNEQYMRHIPFRATMCRKVRQKVEGHWRYIRSCAWLGTPGIDNDERYCIVRSGTWDIHIEYCNCISKDGCNSAGSSKSNWLLVGLCGFGIVLLAFVRR